MGFIGIGVTNGINGSCTGKRRFPANVVPVLLGDGITNFNGLGDNFRANPVAGETVTVITNLYLAGFLEAIRWRPVPDNGDRVRVVNMSLGYGNVQSVRDAAASHGLRIVGLSQVYPFNAWSDAVRGEVLERAPLRAARTA